VEDPVDAFWANGTEADHAAFIQIFQARPVARLDDVLTIVSEAIRATLEVQNE